jgi:hypothetical protein
MCSVVYRRKQILDKLKNTNGYWELKKRSSTISYFVKSLFGRGYGPVTRTMNE